ncbi:NrfD/PsrC family molybdoenzyme membrane anchor subunit [uncultured Jatrophihabitans sp.]|uniref:NrfD/PsrC family molybdoenzyme membrane anchor subunit n=1 Tax=uncultured Jatrophihabitans sp. TaxID=1610747 RepID=UPI0035CB3F11
MTEANDRGNAVDRGGVTDQRSGEHAQPPTQLGSRRRRRRGGRGGDGAPVVPDAEFTSYYGRPVVKASPWEGDIPAYLFLGGLAAGSSLLAAGADVTDRPALRRAARLTALGAISGSFAALVHDLGRPSRFVNMLRVAKPTSPMSVGTWLLTAYGPAAGVAGAQEVVALVPKLLPRPLRVLLQALARPAGLGAAAVAPTIAAYTAVLLTDTATPAWNSARRELPFVFVGSAAAASSGMAMITAPVAQAGPARRLAVAGAAFELAASHRMESSMGLPAEAMHQGTPGRLIQASRVLTAVGALGAALFGRWRPAAVVSGAALVAGSAATRFGVFEAGQASARDPRYTVVPQRERVDARRAEAQDLQA